jgi:hypothetical protein
MTRRRGFYFLLTIILFNGLNSARGQNKSITGDFSGLTFEQFVYKVEAETPYRFYYKISDLDSVQVQAKASQASLEKVLKQIFNNTNFHFAIDSLDHVFVIKRATIQTDLPADFFDRQKKTLDSLKPAADDIWEEPSKKEKLQSSIENKLFEIGTRTNNPGKSNITITGYVRDAKNGEALSGVAVYIDTPSVATLTNQFGYYVLTLPVGRHTLHVSGAGMKETRRQVVLHADGKLNVDLENEVTSLKTVIVVSERRSNVMSAQMGMDKLNIKTIKQVPVLLGESDVLRVVLTLPGVTTAGEASTGFNVRGGSVDQNLILFNDATIYNPSHLFGLFSAFNPDVIKNVELYKSAIPEKYGGRLSSVLDVSTRDGNSKKISGSGGIGPLTSKLTIEGPIIKEKTSFIVAGRTTYSNWILKKVPDDFYKNSRASFYDVNLQLTHTVNTKNSLYLTGYTSSDQFNLNNDTNYKYTNTNVNLKWKHNFNNKLVGVFTGGLDYYKYNVSANKNPVTAYRLKFDIKQYHFRSDFTYQVNQDHALNFGFNSIHYQLNPGTYQPFHQQSLVIPDEVPNEQALESAIYLGDKYTISPKVSLNIGIRYSLFNYLGPRDVYTYAEGLPRTQNSIKDTLRYSAGKAIQNYHGPEYRISARYAITDQSSVKASFNTLLQYIHMLSNTTSISPTDTWKLSDPSIKPQRGYQVSVGYYRNFAASNIETSVEVYYKNMKNYLDYKSNAVLLMNHHIETDVISTKGRAYGAELMIKKTAGKLNGWLSYTYSRTFLRMDDPLAGESINNGKYYPASFDKPHNVNLISNYRFSHRWSASVNVVYNTGRPITLPIAVYNVGGSQRLLYSERNQYRIPDYFRVDLSVNLEGNHKTKQLAHNSWSFGVYNLTGRDNAYSIYFVEERGAIKGYQLSIFGTLIPFVTYKFNF